MADLLTPYYAQDMQVVCPYCLNPGVMQAHLNSFVVLRAEREHQDEEVKVRWLLFEQSPNRHYAERRRYRFRQFLLAVYYEPRDLVQFYEGQYGPGSYEE